MPVHLSINGQDLAAPSGSTLFDLAEAAGVRVPTSCRKNGKCKECVVEVIDGEELLGTPSAAEEHLRPPFRLACQCVVIAPDGIVRCHTMRRGQMRIEHQALGAAGTPREPDLSPAVTRAGTRVLIDGLEVASGVDAIHGLAVDIGTTTVVVRLHDLEDGELIATASFENPQRFGGSDVMSRIQYDTEHPGKVLRRTLAGYLTHAIESFPVDPRTIFEVVVVGNATMRDLFFRQNVYSIGQTPYQSITETEMAAGVRSSTALTETGRRSLLPVHPKARVYGAPLISGHVGADAAACMLAVDMPREERLVAIMDIGTNTELLVGNRDRILAASCPAGPAFEGGGVACGMPALDGAIEDVSIDDGGGIHLGVIGGGPPQGICGSGLIDALAELRRTGAMNELGRFEDGGERVVLDADANVYLSERDINELAQAKGANVAGLRTVMSHYGLGFDAIDVFYLAGGFGRHINIEAAKRIGLIPDLPDDRIVRIGNAAVEGASRLLLSSRARKELEETVRKVEHCRLETHPDFFDFFVFGCQFAPVVMSTRVSG